MNKVSIENSNMKISNSTGISIGSISVNGSKKNKLINEINIKNSDMKISSLTDVNIGSINASDNKKIKLMAKLGRLLSIMNSNDENSINEHPNITVLVKRMTSDLKNSDYAGVLHSSASIFETLAKDIVGIPSIQDQTLASFFSKYQKESKLSPDLQAKILEIYKSRNSMPLAGHGSTKAPTISKDEAVAICELTQAFVRIEYSLREEKEKN